MTNAADPLSQQGLTHARSTIANMTRRCLSQVNDSCCSTSAVLEYTQSCRDLETLYTIKWQGLGYDEVTREYGCDLRTQPDIQAKIQQLSTPGASTLPVRAEMSWLLLLLLAAIHINLQPTGWA